MVTRMSSFVDELIITPTESGMTWLLKHEFRYHIGEYPSRDIITVPEGFETDFASIPRVFWRVLPPWGRYGKAAVVHDYLCVERSRPSAETHKIFLEAMQVLGVSRWKRNIMYWGVRCCGPKW